MNKRERTKSLGDRDDPGKRGKGLTLDTDVSRARGPSTPILLPLKREQRQMVEFGLRSLREYGGVILAAQMGSGKTAAGLVLGALMQTEEPVLFVCTVSIIGGVVADVKKFFGDNMRVHVVEPGVADKSIPPGVDVVVTNRESLASPQLSELHWGTIIIDEAHDLRNPSTERYATLMGLMAHFRVLLTGTPINNGPEEVVSLLEQAGLLEVEQGISHRMYMQKFGDVVLQCMQRSCLRINFNPGKELTRKVVAVRFTEPEAEDHRAAIAEAMTQVESRKHFHVFTLSLNMCARSVAKLRSVKKILDKHYDEQRGMIFFATSCTMQDAILDMCNARGLPVGHINGSMARDDRVGQVELLNTGQIRILVCSRKACQTGLNLQGAADIVIVDLQSCNPFDYLQLECRAYRTGQELDVNVWMLVIAETIESYIPRIHARKIERARGILRVMPTPADFVAGRLRESFIRRSRACFRQLVDVERNRRKGGVEVASEDEVVHLIMTTYAKDGTFIGDVACEDSDGASSSTGSTPVTPKTIGGGLWG